MEALEQLATMKTMAPVYRLMGEDQRQFIADADRPAEIARLQTIITASCSAKGPERQAEESEARRLRTLHSPDCAFERDRFAQMERPSTHTPESIAAVRRQTDRLVARVRLELTTSAL